MFSSLGPPGMNRALTEQLLWVIVLLLGGLQAERALLLARHMPVSSAGSISVNGVQGRSVMMQSVSPFPSAIGQQQLD